MSIGISCMLPNEWGNYLATILQQVDLSNYCWRICENEVFEEPGNHFFDLAEWISGSSLLNALNSEKHYPHMVKYLAFRNKSDDVAIHTYEEFINSDCELVVLIADGVYLDIYSKDESVNRLLYSNARKAGFSDIILLTEENDERTGLDI